MSAPALSTTLATRHHTLKRTGRVSRIGSKMFASSGRLVESLSHKDLTVKSGTEKRLEIACISQLSSGVRQLAAALVRRSLLRRLSRLSGWIRLTRMTIEVNTFGPRLAEAS